MKYLLSLFIALMLSSLAIGQNLQFEQLLNTDFVRPVEIASTYIENDTRLFVVEKRGYIYIIEDPEAELPITKPEPFLDLSNVVDDEFEGGLLGLAFHPDYATSGEYFVNYTFTDPDDGIFYTRVSRFTVNPLEPHITDPSTEVIVMTIAQPKKNHNGGDLVFGPDGMLYIPTGDGGGSGDQYKNAQDRTSYLGKVLRIDVNTDPYSIPEDNPFIFDDQTQDEIWSLGWRNPWRVAFDFETGDFWAADVGQNEIEEIDMEPAGSPGGKNYGWNCFEGSLEYNDEQCPDGIMHEEPVFEYDQSQGQKSVTGGFVYRGTRHPDLVGKYIFTDFVDSRVWWLSEKISNTEVVTERFELIGIGLPVKVSSFGESSSRELYFATYDDGRIWKVMTDVFINIEEEQEDLLKIYPNPAQNSITINSTNFDISNIEILDIQGKKYDCNRVENSFDVSALQSGQYIFRYQLDTQTYSQNFQIAR